MEGLIKGRPYGTLARSVPCTLRVGAVRHHQQHALVAQIRETAEICHLAINRGIIQLKVAGMDNRPHRRSNRQPHCIRDTVIHPDKIHMKTACLDGITLHDSTEIAGIHAILLQPALQDAQGQPRAINGNINLLQHIRQRTDMVLMTMSQHNSLHLVLVLHQIRNIRNNQVNAEHFLVREHQAGIDK